jgi:predicted enzyme related to lactoylglutathione lyase
VSTEIQQRGVGRLRAIIIDVSDLDRAAAFWSGMLGEEAGERRGQYRTIGKPPTATTGRPAVVLQEVAEPKVGKARLRLDFACDDLDAAMSFVKGLGGSKVHTVTEGGFSMIVAADTEGNEFCLIPSTG